MREIQVGDMVRVNATAPIWFHGRRGRLQRYNGSQFAGHLGGYRFYASELDLIDAVETQQTQLPPVSVASLALPPDEPVSVPADPDVEPQPYDMPSPEADALDRIADLFQDGHPVYPSLAEVEAILRETGRL